MKNKRIELSTQELFFKNKLAIVQNRLPLFKFYTLTQKITKGKAARTGLVKYLLCVITIRISLS